MNDKYYFISYCFTSNLKDIIFAHTTSQVHPIIWFVKSRDNGDFETQGMIHVRLVSWQEITKDIYDSYKNLI